MNPAVQHSSNFSECSDSDDSESDHGRNSKKQGHTLSLMESDDTEEQDSSDHNDDGKEGKDGNSKKMKLSNKKDGKDSEKSESEDESEPESEDESESESEFDSDDDSTEEKEDDFDHQWEELRNEAPDTNQATRRIAVCNMDWDRIRAVDLLVCFNSFKPPNGTINSVKIYPSEFGLKRMEEEKLKGPPELVEETLPLDEEDVDDKKGSKFHREKLRQYQISRLKYYYGVVDCDSPETANTLYEQLNGMEYESSSVRYDLRFIPDDVTFDHEPTSVADKVPDDYKPRLFVTSALQQVKVDLTWDETAPKRREFFQKVFTNIDSVENDIHDYLASASSESEGEIGMADEESGKELKTSERMAKYRDLLKSLEEKEKKEEKYDVEITWEPSLKEKTEQKVKEKIKKNSLNPFEEMLQKKKDQKKMKKTELIQNQNEDSVDLEGIESPSYSSLDYVVYNQPGAEGPFYSSMNTAAFDELDAESVLELPVVNQNADGTFRPLPINLITKKPAAESKCKSKNDKLAELGLISDYQKETESENKLKKKKKKRKCEDLDGFVPDMNDPRFSAMYTSSLFNIVSSDQHPKKKDGSFGSKHQKGGKFKSSKGHKSKKTAKRDR